MSCGLTQAVVHAEQLHFTPYRAKMRFSVRRLDVCPGEEKRILRKDALYATDRMQNAPFGEAQIASKIVVYGRREKKTIACPRMSVRPRND